MTKATVAPRVSSIDLPPGGSERVLTARRLTVSAMRHMLEKILKDSFKILKDSFKILEKEIALKRFLTILYRFFEDILEEAVLKTIV